ncbi:MAG: Spy/CpxP family protein refolding chaperone [Thermoguttaceae bacterium]
MKMKNFITKSILFSVSFLIIFTISRPVLAQPMFGPGNPPPPGFISAVGRKLIESTADGSTTTMMYAAAISDANIQKELGITDDQKKKLKQFESSMRAEMIKKIPSYIEKLKNYSPDVEREAINEVQNFIQQSRAKLDEIITPEQKEKARSLSFQAFGGLDSPLVNADMIKALNLSDDQKEKAKKIFEETEKERRELMEEALGLAEKAVALAPRDPGQLTQEEMQALQEKGQALEGQAKALESRVYASGKKLGSKIRAFLTDAQRKQADELMASRPDFFGPLPKQLRGEEESGEWKPSDSSWKPGDGDGTAPTPRKERRFPGKNKTDTNKEEVKNEDETKEENQ